MKLLTEMNYFYYKMSLYELQLMSEKDYFDGLSYNSLLYINVIAQMKDCTASKIAKALNVTKSAVTLKLNELEKQGMIEKLQSTVDKRIQYILLKQNISALLSIYDTVFSKIEKKIEKQFSTQELTVFKTVLSAISNLNWVDVCDE